MPYVRVGGGKTAVSWSEYFCAVLPNGTLVSFSIVPRHTGRKMVTAGIGRVTGSMFYDEVVLFVATDDSRTISIFPNQGDRVRRIKESKGTNDEQS